VNRVDHCHLRLYLLGGERASWAWPLSIVSSDVKNELTPEVDGTTSPDERPLGGAGCIDERFFLP